MTSGSWITRRYRLHVLRVPAYYPGFSRCATCTGAALDDRKK